MKTNVLKVSLALIIGLFVSSCASTNHRSPTLPEHQKASQDAPYFKSFNSNWIRHGGF